jgi:hypothetical protein
MSRVGNFTSSQVYRLCTFGRAKDSIGAPFYTYIQEKVDRTQNRPTHWQRNKLQIYQLGQLHGTVCISSKNGT